MISIILTLIRSEKMVSDNLDNTEFIKLITLLVTYLSAA